MMLLEEEALYEQLAKRQSKLSSIGLPVWTGSILTCDWAFGVLSRDTGSRTVCILEIDSKSEIGSIELLCKLDIEESKMKLTDEHSASC